MAQRFKSRRPDQERYVPRSMRNENTENPLHINPVEKVNADNVIEKSPCTKIKSSKIEVNDDKANNIQKINKKKAKSGERKETKEKINEMSKGTEKVDDILCNNTVNEQMNTLALNSESLNRSETGIVYIGPSNVITEDHDEVTNKVNKTLYKAACSVSNLLCDLIFTSVYKSVPKKKHNHKVIETCSARIISKVLSDSFESSLPGIRKSKRKIKQANVYSETLSHSTLKAAFKGINDTRKKQAVEYPPPQAISKELHLQLMIPEIATNIINIAIENAIEISKASAKEEAKSTYVCSTHQNENPTHQDTYPTTEADSVDTYSMNLNKRTCNEIQDMPSLEKSVSCITLDDAASRLNPSLYEDLHTSTSNNNESLADSKLLDDNSNDRLTKPEDEKLDQKNDEVKKKKKNDVKPSKATKKKRKNKPVQDPTSDLSGSTETDVLPLPSEEGQPHDESVTGCEHEEEDSWFSNYTEDGECLTKEVYEKFVLDDTECSDDKNGQVINYMEFNPKDIVLDIGEFGHVLELYEFSSTLKSSDINIALKAAGVNDYSLHWVDDSHALAVFASKAAAHSAMKKCTPVLQMRQVVNGTRQSRIKIKDLKGLTSFSDVLLPYKKRPQTTSMVARNLVAGSLGLRSNTTKEQRDKEKEMLRKAREEKRLKEKKKRDIWDSPDGN